MEAAAVELTGYGTGDGANPLVLGATAQEILPFGPLHRAVRHVAIRILECTSGDGSCDSSFVGKIKKVLSTNRLY